MHLNLDSIICVVTRETRYGRQPHMCACTEHLWMHNPLLAPHYVKASPGS